MAMPECAALAQLPSGQPHRGLSSENIKKNRARAQWQDFYYKYASRESNIRADHILKTIEHKNVKEDEELELVQENPDSEDKLYVSQGVPDIESEWKQ
jgi:hypothetical protein